MQLNFEVNETGGADALLTGMRCNVSIIKRQGMARPVFTDGLCYLRGRGKKKKSKRHHMYVGGLTISAFYYMFYRVVYLHYPIFFRPQRNRTFIDVKSTFPLVACCYVG